MLVWLDALAPMVYFRYVSILFAGSLAATMVRAILVHIFRQSKSARIES
jgi:hypothetical protein